MIARCWPASKLPARISSGWRSSARSARSSSAWRRSNTPKERKTTMNTANAAKRWLKRLQRIEATEAGVGGGERTREGPARTKAEWSGYVEAHDQVAVAALRASLRSREQECANLFQHPEERGRDADG